MSSESDRCVVWLVNAGPEGLSFEADRYISVLDEVELDRRRSYHTQDDIDRFTIGAGLLRVAVAAHSSGRPATVAAARAIRVDRSCADCDRQHGRPLIDIAGLHVSVAHSGAVVAVAVTGAGPCGVDVELVPRDFQDLVDVALSPGERLSVLDAAGFACVWTRKEAVVKATGAGLRTDPSRVVVSSPDASPELYQLGPGPAPPCWIRDLGPETDYVGAVAVLTSRPLELEICDGSLSPSGAGLR